MKRKNTVQEINSRQNARFKEWVSLLDAKGVKKSGLCLVSGPKVIQEILRDQPERGVEILLPPKTQSPHPGLPAFALESALFRELDVIGTKSPLLVCKTPALETWKPLAPKGLEVIAALSDPNNLGALLRSAEAFGARRVILTRECSSPFLPRALRAAAGSTFRIPLASGPALAEIDVPAAVGLDLTGEDISTFQFSQDVYLVLGEEGQGLPKDLNLTRLSIPMSSTVESLNATVAASIALFSYHRQHSKMA